MFCDIKLLNVSHIYSSDPNLVIAVLAHGPAPNVARQSVLNRKLDMFSEIALVINDLKYVYS